MHPTSRILLDAALISSVFTVLLADIYKDHMNKVIDYIVHPFVSFDLDGNGEPDLDELKRKTLRVGSRVFPVGKITLNLMVMFIKLTLLILVTRWYLKRFARRLKL